MTYQSPFNVFGARGHAMPFACFPQSWTSELVPPSCLFNIIAFVTKGDFELNRTC